MGRTSQRKGRGGEIELAHALQSYGYDVRPGEPLNYGKEPDLSGLPNIHIECKRAETLRLSEWMAQATKDAQRFHDGAPTLFYRRSREPWRVVMNFSDWIQLYKGRGCRCNGQCGKSKGNPAEE